jgi:hypothetical protein
MMEKKTIIKISIIVGLVLLLFGISPLPRDLSVYTVTSDGVKFNFNSNAFNKKTLLCEKMGTVLSFNRKTGEVLDLYSGQITPFDYKADRDTIQMKNEEEEFYDQYVFEHIEGGIEISTNEEQSFDMFYLRKNEKDADYFFINSESERIAFDLNSENLSIFSNDKAMVSGEGDVALYAFEKNNGMVMLSNGEQVYRYIDFNYDSEKENSDMNGIYISEDLKHILALEEKGAGYIEMRDKRMTFDYVLMDEFILCYTTNDERFVIGFEKDDDKLNICLYPQLGYPLEKHELIKVS